MYCTIQYSCVQYNTVQLRTVQLYSTMYWILTCCIFYARFWWMWIWLKFCWVSLIKIKQFKLFDAKLKNLDPFLKIRLRRSWVIIIENRIYMLFFGYNVQVISKLHPWQVCCNYINKYFLSVPDIKRIKILEKTFAWCNTRI